MKKNDGQKVPKIPIMTQLLGYISGKSFTHLISVAAKLGIADLLVKGPKTVEELSIATDTHAPSLYRFMRVLDRIGIFSEVESKKFSITKISKLFFVSVHKIFS